MAVFVPAHPRVFVALYGGCVVFCTMLFLLSWDCIDSSSKRLPSARLKYYSIISIIMYAISACVMLIYFILLDLFPDSLFQATLSDRIFQMCWGLFWRMGQAFLYLLFLERLKHSFKHTKYASANNTFYIFYIAISIFITSYIIKTSITFYLDYHNHDEDTDSLYAIVGDVDMIITQLIDLSLSIGIMALFLNKLYQLNVDLTDINIINPYHGLNGTNTTQFHHYTPYNPVSHSINHSACAPCTGKTKPRKLSLNTRQKTIIGIMAKITLLSGVALASNQCFLFLSGALYLTQLIPKYKHLSQLLWSIKMAYFAVNAVIISISIVLQFDFSYKFYKKSCNRIDKICVKCCTWRTKKKIKSLSTSSCDNLIDINPIQISNPSNHSRSQHNMNDDPLLCGY